MSTFAGPCCPLSDKKKQTNKKSSAIGNFIDRGYGRQKKNKKKSVRWWKPLHCTRGNTPVLKTNAKFYQLIKHAKISYSIASLVF